MTSKWITSLISGFALVGMTLSSVAPASAAQAPDKSGPGVVRVSVVQGTAVVQRSDSNKQVAAVVNAPLLPGDYISTGARSRGELQFDGSTAVRLGGNVQARITGNDPNDRHLQLADGTIEVGLIRDSGMVAVDTPSVTVEARRAGDYRISIDRDGASWVTARRGRAKVVTPQRTYTLEPGRTLVARGAASDPSITFASEIGYDSFDDFNAKRDETMVAALNASPNLNPDIAGYSNLGAYGQWQDVAGYGQAWVPDQTSSWSPYSDGYWTWADGYGWTWVAAEPWGWAPYHYGRWFYANGYGWAWYPPAYGAYPAWSPALVGFFGFGAGFGVSVGFGFPYIGWYPLWPYAPYYPWYPGWAWTGWGWGWPGWGWGGCCGFGSVNVVNVTNITNIYRHFPRGGIHGVSVSRFRNGTISGHTFSVDPHRVGTHIGMIHGAVPVTPGRGSLGFGGRRIDAPVTLSKRFDSKRFASVAHRALSGRMSFDRQQKTIAATIARGRKSAPLSRASSRSAGGVDRGAMRSASTGSHAAQARRPDTRSASWQRFDRTRGAAARTAMATHAGRVHAAAGGRAASDSWSRFSRERASLSGSHARQSYARGASAARDTYGRDTYGRDTYSRDTYGRDTYHRNPYASSSSARDSYARPSQRTPYAGSYSHRSYPSYSHRSYPSYSHRSYPSYSRGSYPSYSRGSYPSYARGGYAAPHQSGGYAAPHQSGGSSAPHQSGGGRGDGSRGRPPQR